MPPDLYPASPQSATAEVVTTRAYKRRVALVVLALTAFAALYLGLLAASIWLLTLVYSTKLTFYSFMLGLGVVMLIAFLVKELFKRSGVGRDHLIALEEADQPDLFGFVRRLCKETNSRFPKGIFISHEVNAAVFSKTSFLSLFLPQRKSLLVGLGLVNVLTVSELKAVLAHEFGHFTQSSTRFGQYGYRANRMVDDMVNARDSWDRLLAQWRRIDIRLSFPAWILAAVVWVLRKLLVQLAKIVNLASRSLSREMEFDADALAVRLAGSDAIVSSLWKLERAAVAMGAAVRTLGAMADHGRFSDDLFHHQSRAERRFLRWIDTKEEDTPYLRSLRAPYIAGQALHFQEGDDHAPSMWATHPSNRDREMRAKQRYVPCQALDTPAWRLFRQPDFLRRRATLAAYEQLLERRPSARDLTPAAEVEALYREELAEVKQAPHYHDFYENRVVAVAELVATAVDGSLVERDPASLREKVLPYTGDALAAFAKETSAPSDAQASAAAQKRLRAADEAIFLYFHALSSGETRDELMARDRFLGAVQILIVKLMPEERRLEAVLEFIQANREVERADLQQLVQELNQVAGALSHVWKMAGEVTLPKLAHMTEKTTVQSFAFVGQPSFVFGGSQVEGERVLELVKTFGPALSRLRKLHFKNLGALLRLQEELDPTLYPPRAPEDDDEAQLDDPKP